MLTQEYLQTLYAQAQLLWQPLSPYTPPSWHFLAHYLGPGEVDHYYAFARSYLAPYRTYILICAILCVATALYPIFARCLTRTSRIAQSRNALQAMLYVLTPTRSVWPQHYITAAKSTAYSQRKTLQLSLRNTVDDVLSGRMELRAPQQDIPYLLRNALEVDGWTLGLHIDRSWRLDLIRWVLAAQFAPSMSKNALAECAAESASLRSPTWDIRYEGHPLIPSQLSDALPLAISLDQVAYTLLEPAIRALQSSMAQGCSLTLVFTTSSESISVLSSDFAFVSLPFSPLLDRAHAPKNATPTPRRRGCGWAPAPLFSSLPQILQLLASGPSPLAVTAIFNLSEENARSLNAYAEGLQEDRSLMQEFIQRRGVESWRAEQFRASWEAACLTTGLLEKWAIVIRR